MRLADSTTDTVHRKARAVRCLASAVLGLALTQLSACVEKVSEKTQYADEGSLQDHSVVSANPKADSSAFQEAMTEETQVRWGVIERKGPRPIWNQFGDKSRGPKEGEELQPKAGAKQADSVRPVPSTQPAVAEVPTTQPTTRPSALVNEAELPVKIIDLPDGKVRMLWTMRSYGGATVSSKRDASTARRDVTLTPPDLAPLTALVTQTVGTTGAVTALPRENMLVITCDRAVKATVLELLDKLDVPQKQVEITARIFEVSHDFDFQHGAQVIAERLAADSTQNLTSTFSAARALEQMATPGAPFQGGVLHLTKAFQEQGISVDATFQMLAEEGLIKIVSSPRMTVAVGQTGYMLAGKELPVQSATVANNVLSTATQYKPVGVQLYITPQAVGDNKIKLHTISIVSAVSGFTPLPALSGSNRGQAMVNPIIDSREAETAVTIDNGDTLVISGLRMMRTTTRENKIPGLGDLPLAGWLFKNHRSQSQMTDLYFFVTPTILETASAQ